jgi:hypothetical protein
LEQELLSEYGRCLLVEAVDWEGVPSGWYFYNARRERIALKASWDEEGSAVLLDEGSSPVTLRLRPKLNGGLTVSTY